MAQLGEIGSLLVRRLRLLAHPLTLLIAQGVLVFCVMLWAGRLAPVRVPDTASYLVGAGGTSLEQSLAHYRTFAYPLFLRGLGGSELDLAPVPKVQLLVYLGGILLFWYAWRLYSGSRWLAYAAAFPLPFAVALGLANLVQPDFLSIGATLVAVSLAILLSIRPSSRVVWLGIGVTVFLAYQLRPAAVFLVGFIPLLAWSLRLLRSSSRPPRHLGWALGLTATTLLPYLAFCAVRLVAVGDFGLVSFGGSNLAGVAACFIDQQLVDELPERERGLAAKVLHARRRRGWRALTVNDASDEWFAQYSDNIFRIAIPIAEQQVRAERRRARNMIRRGEASEDLLSTLDWRFRRIVRNDRLSEFARAVIRRRPLLYLKWVQDSLLYGLGQLLDFGWIKWPLILLIFSQPIAWLSGNASGEQRRPGAEASPEWAYSSRNVLLAFVVLSGGYFLGYLLLVALVSFPFYRYFVGMIVFLPCLLCVELFEVWRRILSPPPRL